MKTLVLSAFLLSMVLVLGTSPDSWAQFRDRGGPGSSSGRGGWPPSGGGGPGGPGGPGSGGPGRSGGFLFFMIGKDPQGLFDKLAKGRDHFLISETFSLREPLTQFAKDQNITNDKITRDHFVTFTEQMKTKLLGDGAKSGPPSPFSPGGPPTGKTDPSTSDAEALKSRMEFDFRRRDRNGDGKLNQDEMSDRMRSELSQWDKNGDGLIDMEEFRPYFMARFQQRPEAPPASGTAGPGAPPGSTPGTVVTIIGDDELENRPVMFRSGKLPKDLPSWFQEIDKDLDGQVALAEWRKAGKPVNEFLEMDRNNDGLLTAEEVLRFQAQLRSDKEGHPQVARSSSSPSESGGLRSRGGSRSSEGGGPPWMRSKKSKQ